VVRAEDADDDKGAEECHVTDGSIGQ
jgi:hypothetical protein